jgi:hypothetical protein
MSAFWDDSAWRGVAEVNPLTGMVSAGKHASSTGEGARPFWPRSCSASVIANAALDVDRELPASHAVIRSGSSSWTTLERSPASHAWRSPGLTEIDSGRISGPPKDLIDRGGLRSGHRGYGGRCASSSAVGR